MTQYKLPSRIDKSLFSPGKYFTVHLGHQMSNVVRDMNVKVEVTKVLALLGLQF